VFFKPVARLSGGTPTSGPSRLSDGLQADPLDGLLYPASHFDLYNLDQLQEDDRESDRCVYSSRQPRCSSPGPFPTGHSPAHLFILHIEFHMSL